MKLKIAYCHQCDSGAVSLLEQTTDLWADKHGIRGAMEHQRHLIEFYEVPIVQQVELRKNADLLG